MKYLQHMFGHSIQLNNPVDFPTFILVAKLQNKLKKLIAFQFNLQSKTIKPPNFDNVLKVATYFLYISKTNEERKYLLLEFIWLV